LYAKNEALSFRRPILHFSPFPRKEKGQTELVTRTMKKAENNK
jgi:hypothetical protein